MFANNGVETLNVDRQIYPYKNAGNGFSKPGQGITGAASYNSLCYCAQISRTTSPRTTKLLWSGNFTALPSTADTNDQIDGTFIIGSKCFMEGFLLPTLQKVAQAMEICHTETPSADRSGNDLWISAPITFHQDPAHPNIEDPVYTFRNLNPNAELDGECGYIWERKRSWPLSGTYWDDTQTRATCEVEGIHVLFDSIVGDCIRLNIEQIALLSKLRGKLAATLCA
jgi:hypothetical protein